MKIYLLGSCNVEGSYVEYACKSEETARKRFEDLKEEEVKDIQGMIEFTKSERREGFYDKLGWSEEEIEEFVNNDIKRDEDRIELIKSQTFNNQDIDYIHDHPFWKKVELEE